MIDQHLVKPGHGKLQKQRDEWKLKCVSKYSSFFMIKMKESIPLGSQIQDKTTKLNTTKFNLRLYSNCHVDIKKSNRNERLPSGQHYTLYYTKEQLTLLDLNVTQISLKTKRRVTISDHISALWLFSFHLPQSRSLGTLSRRRDFCLLEYQVLNCCDFLLPSIVFCFNYLFL